MHDTDLLPSLAEIAGASVRFGALITVPDAGASEAHEASSGLVYMDESTSY